MRQQDGFSNGFAIDDIREIAPEPKALYARLKRVKVKHLTGGVTDETIAARFAEQPQRQMLCIVNSRAHARALFNAIRELPGAAHLTAVHRGGRRLGAVSHPGAPSDINVGSAR